MIDFRDDVTAAESQVFRKRSGFNFGHDHALLSFHADAVAELWRQFLDVQPKFSRSRFAWLVAHASRHIREDARAVFHRSGRFLRRAVADVSKLHFAADRGLRDWIHQVISGLHRLAVYTGDDVAALQAGLLSRATRLDVLDHHAVGRAKRFQRNRIRAQLFLEAYADGTACDPSLLDDLVVDADGRR